MLSQRTFPIKSTSIRKFLARLMLCSGLLTLPLSIAFVYWAINTAENFYTFGVKYDTAPVPTRLLFVGLQEYEHMKISLRNALLPEMLVDRPDWPTISLTIDEDNLDKLNANMPHSGFEYVEGQILNDNILRKVKIRYRGDNAWHWAGHKKSLRIKTKRSRLFDGMRSFNLIAPKTRTQVSEYLSYRLAGLMGLPVPKTKMVNLLINGKYDGFRMLVEQLEEMTLRKNGLMPGDLYVGELIGRDAYLGASDMVFDHPGLWEKAAINNHYESDTIAPLRQLIDLINAPDSEKKQRELSELLDMQAWGVFGAFDVLCQGQHYNDSHNWRLYYDPARSKFYPVIWDPMGWYLPFFKAYKRDLDLDILSSRLHMVLIKNGDFVRARQQALADFFNNDLDESFMTELVDAVREVKKAVKYSPHIEGEGRINASIDEFEKTVGKVLQTIESVYLGGSIELSYQNISDQNSSDQNMPSSQSLALAVDGRQSITRLSLNYKHDLPSQLGVKLRYWVDGQLRERDISGLASIKANKLYLDVDLIAYYKFASKPKQWPNPQSIELEAAYYEITIEGLSRVPHLLGIDAKSLAGDWFHAQAQSNLAKKGFAKGYYLAKDVPVKRPQYWSGEITINDLQEINDEVIIAPNTQISMGPGAGIIFKNKVTAIGKSDARIVFKAKVQDQEPWGAVVLKGKAASASTFEFCEFSKGSGLKAFNYEYSAMFSVHDVSSVNIDNCIFRDSQLVDDMVHVVYSDIEFKNCLFERSFADALDADISRISLNNCDFIDSGNDAIDLMSTKAVVVDVKILNSSDKGISVGEDSAALVVNSLFERNEIGVQAKDASVVSLFNITMHKNNKAIDAYKKNWRYGSGGYVNIYKSYIEKNSDSITADKKSGIYVYDTYVEGMSDESINLEQDTMGLNVNGANTLEAGSLIGKSRIYLHESARNIVVTQRKKVASLELDRQVDELERLGVLAGMDTMALGRIDPSRRGWAVEN